MAPRFDKRVERAQLRGNAFTRKYLEGVPPIEVDGIKGHATDVRIESIKWYLGFGASRHAPDSEITDKYLRALADPKGKWLGPRALAAGAKRRRTQRKRSRSRKPRGRFTSRLWGGSRAVTDEIIAIVRAYDPGIPVTSRKRGWGNWGSDHHFRALWSDAVDLGTANNHRLKNHIASKLTGGKTKAVGDYGSFNVTRNGRTYRVQSIAGTHGTGPHLHEGVKRIR